MFELKKHRFWVTFKGDDIEELYIKIADTPYISSETIARIENEKDALERYEKEKNKIQETIPDGYDYKGELLVIEEIEEDGIFKGCGLEIESYINCKYL